MATRIGIIGCGYWGPKHARNFHEMPDAELTWVADLSEQRLAHMQSLYPYIKTTRNYREMLESNVDAVVVSTPVSTHRKIGLDILNADKHVLIEKPLAATAAEATELVQAANRAQKVLMVGHTFVYNPAVQAVRSIIRSGELGDIFYINATRANLGLFQQDINVVWDLAPHDVSILNYILDAVPLSVSTHGGIYVQREQRIHDVAYLTLTYPPDIMAEVRVSWLDPVKTRQYTIVGSKKMLVYDDIAHAKVVIYDKGVNVPPYSDTLEQFQLSYRHGTEYAYPIFWAEPLRNECQAFVDAIKTGNAPLSDGIAGLRVVEILEKAQRSLLNHGVKEEVQQ